MTSRLAADIGGTFTDLVMIDDRGNLRVHKTPSTPADLTTGVMQGVGQIVADHLGSSDLGLLDTFVHGATVVLNALLQRTLPATGLITTAGFRDVLEIMRTNNPEMYNLQYVKPKPLVPRYLRLEVKERIRHTGEVLIPLDEDDVAVAVEELEESRVEAIGVCLLHAYANPTHERRIGAILAERLPGVAVCLSSAVAPEWREFERTSTTCVNAATTPIIKSYLGRLSTKLTTRGLERELLVMQSNGGVMTATAAADWPVRTVMSGPCGGVVGASRVADAIGCEDVLTIDIGGTSSDMGVIAGGKAEAVAESSVGEGWPVLAPMIEILSIGAGGGSIAWLDGGGALRVGPRSAGADPGPACYGHGGIEPTVTDANVVLGRIDPGYFLGGEMEIDAEAACAALERRIASPMGIGVLDAANGVVRIVNMNMARAMRSILLERGHDPRDFVLMTFGGAGGLHAAALMRDLDISHAVIPNNPGALSAIGMLGTDFRHDRSRTYVGDIDDLDPRELDAIFEELEAEATRALCAQGRPEASIALVRSADLRYVGQEYHLNVDCPPRGTLVRLSALAREFNAAHERVYGYATPTFSVQLVNLRVTAISSTNRPGLPTINRRDRASILSEEKVREVFFRDSGWKSTPIYLVDCLRARDCMLGPAIIEDPRSTMLVLPGQQASIDEFRNLHIHEIVSDTATNRTT